MRLSFFLLLPHLLLCVFLTQSILFCNSRAIDNIMEDTSLPKMSSEAYFKDCMMKLFKYRNEGLFCDAVLVTGNCGLRAHSVVLAASSSVLKNALVQATGTVRYLYLPQS